MMKHLFITLIVMAEMTAVYAQNVVDVHTHNILPAYLEVLGENNALLDETFPLPSWNVESHLKFMEEAGIKTSILTMPAPHPYFGDIDQCRKAIRQYNEETAELTRKYPGKFYFCASLPLPDVNAAIDEAIYALDSLGAVGIKLATNSRGQYVGDKELDPLMEVLNERNAVVILHPHKPAPVNDSLIAITPLAAYEYPAETSRAVINIISRNVLARYPNVKVVVPHCGSYLPLAIPRLQAILPAMLAKGLMEPIDFEANLDNLYFDLAGKPTLELLNIMLTITTPEHILYGSDYPYQPDEFLLNNQAAFAVSIEGDEANKYLTGNAKKLFNLH